jgi:hypothetical protein
MPIVVFINSLQKWREKGWKATGRKGREDKREENKVYHSKRWKGKRIYIHEIPPAPLQMPLAESQ